MNNEFCHSFPIIILFFILGGRGGRVRLEMHDVTHFNIFLMRPLNESE